MKQLIEVNIGKENCLNLKEWNKKWEIIKTIKPVYIGKNGITQNKEEGDKKTPLGLYKIGPAFGTKELNINYPYLTITKNSYFVDDINSAFYNNWVELGDIPIHGYSYVTNSDKITWNSAEHLIDYPIAYELGLIIEYNMENTIKGKGSAIFCHIKNKDYTEGCIAINKNDMEYIINWLDKDKNPHILIQTKRDFK